MNHWTEVFWGEQGIFYPEEKNPGISFAMQAKSKTSNHSHGTNLNFVIKKKKVLVDKI